MPFLDSLDIGNRALQHVGMPQLTTINEDSPSNREVSFAYDKVRRAELRRNTWRFAVRHAVIRALNTTTLILVPPVYESSATYLIGEIVRDTNGQHWFSQISNNANNEPGGNNIAWDMYFGPMTVSLYDSGTAYFSGELVYTVDSSAPAGYRVFVSLTNANSTVPGTASDYSAATQYKLDDVVSYGGFLWRSLMPVNVANTPAVGPAAWAAGTTYASGNTVTASNQRIYTSAQAGNLGNDPTVDDGTYWTASSTFTAWTKTPTLSTSATSWRPLNATLKNLQTIYPIGTGPSSQAVTRNIYRLPAGFLRLAPQDPKAGSTSYVGAPGGLEYRDWNLEGNYIVTSESGPLSLRFVADISQVSAMDDMFCEGLACRIATAICEPLTQSSSKLQTIASAYKLFMGDARLANAIEIGSEEPPVDDWIACRA